MADGTFAALLFLLSFSDMHANYCETDLGCFARSEVVPRVYFSVGEVQERHAKAGSEIYLRYDLGHKNGPLGHAIGLSLSGRGETWFGAGQSYIAGVEDYGLKIEFHAMTGLYDKGSGHDLGGRLAFRSGVDLIYEKTGGLRYAVSYDHRSNMGIYKENPGIETIQFAVSFPLY